MYGLFLNLLTWERLRGVEVRNLTDAHIRDESMLFERTKGSNANIAAWNDRLRHIVDLSISKRATIWKRIGRPVPFKPDQRYLVVSYSDGNPIKRSAWQSTWRRFSKLAIDQGITSSDQYFSLHDMKRRGVTDTEGTRDERKDAAGHRTNAAFDRYDFTIPVVKPSSD